MCKYLNILVIIKYNQKKRIIQCAYNLQEKKRIIYMIYSLDHLFGLRDR